MVKQAPRNSGEISLEKSSDANEIALTLHDQYIDKIYKTMNTTVAKSSGAQEGWGQLSGPSTVTVTPDYNNHSSDITYALLSDTHQSSRLITEGNQVVAASVITELQRVVFNRITSAMEAKGIDPSKSPYLQSVHLVDETDYPNLSPDQFSILEEISKKAVQFIDSAVARRQEDSIKPASLEINKRGLSYIKNPEHLVLAA